MNKRKTNHASHQEHLFFTASSPNTLYKVLNQPIKHFWGSFHTPQSGSRCVISCNSSIFPKDILYKVLLCFYDSYINMQTNKIVTSSMTIQIQ